MQIRYDTNDAVGTLTLSGPPSNALDRPDFTELDTLRSFLETPGLRAVIVTGEGHHFCAGAQMEALREQARSPEQFAQAMNRGKVLLETIAAAPVPVAAAIRGSCLGAGLEIALACHFRVAASSAMFGFPEVEHGLMPGLGGTVTDRATRAALVSMILSGDMVLAEDAAAKGLVDRVVAPSEVDTCAHELLMSLVGRRSEVVVRSIMQSIANARLLPRRDALMRETELFCALAARGEASDD